MNCYTLGTKHAWYSYDDEVAVCSTENFTSMKIRFVFYSKLSTRVAAAGPLYRKSKETVGKEMFSAVCRQNGC